jgi:hypothetical protein
LNRVELNRVELNRVELNRVELNRLKLIAHETWAGPKNPEMIDVEFLQAGLGHWECLKPIGTNPIDY